MAKIEFALRLAEQGFRVFPLQPNGKRPLPDSNGYLDATRDVGQIESWWSAVPNANIGVATGGHFFVIDADTKEGRTGAADLELVEMLHALPPSLRVATPSGGTHLYLAKDPARVLVSNAGKVDGYPGLDIRAEGGYVVGPGSTVGNGEYAISTDAETAPCPESFFPLLRKPLAARVESTIELDLPEHIERAKDWLVNQAPEATEGAGGDQITFSVAAELRAMGVSEATALELMLEHWNETKASPPWQPDELAVKVANGFSYGQGAAGGKTAAGEFGEVDLGELSEERIQTSDSSPAGPRVVAACDFAPLAKPERKWFVKDLIPHRNVTILNGDGGTGKSLLAMQASVAAATGARWIGQTVTAGPVLYFSAEDDEDETHIRLKEIVAAERMDLAAVSRLRIALMAGEDALLAVESPSSAVLIRTKLFDRLRAWLAKYRPVLLVLDNLADIFGGNENVKSLARQFIGMLRGLAIEFDCAILLLAHPSLSGMASGSGSSGNVAWNNSVRSRLYLQRDKAEDGTEHDADRRYLEVKKANYSATGLTVDLRWEHGRFVALDIPELVDIDGAGQGVAAPETKVDRAERIFLEMVDRFNREGRNVSPSLGANYAPTVFSRHPRADGMSRGQLESAMNTLLDAGKIVVEMVGYKSKQRQNITLARDVK